MGSDVLLVKNGHAALIAAVNVAGDGWHAESEETNQKMHRPSISTIHRDFGMNKACDLRKRKWLTSLLTGKVER